MWPFSKKQKSTSFDSVFNNRQFNTDIDKTGFKDYFGNGFTLESDDLRIVDFNDSSQVSPAEIKRWHKEVIEWLIEHPELEWTRMSSGNSMVIGYINYDGYIEIIEITNGFREWVYKNHQIKKPNSEPDVQECDARDAE